MYGVYNVETLEKLIKTIHTLHSRQSIYESLFAGRVLQHRNIIHKRMGNKAYNIMLLPHYTIKDKYIEIYNEFITQLRTYAKAVRILAKRYLPISLIMPLKVKEILTSVKETLMKTNPDYDIVIKILHVYYDMKLVTFGIDSNRNSIILFPIFIQSYTQQPLIFTN